MAGVAGLLAGAFSMAAGEYTSMRVQRELFERQLHIEAHEIGTDPEGETAELASLLERKGIPAPVARQAAESLMAEPETALEVHPKEELGLDPNELGSPPGAAISSFGTFVVGALLPITPYFFAGGAAAAAASIVIAVGSGGRGGRDEPVHRPERTLLGLSHGSPGRFGCSGHLPGWSPPRGDGPGPALSTRETSFPGLGRRIGVERWGVYSSS